MIERYGFGIVVISGKTYTSDVLVFPDRVKSGWWRKEGHKLFIEDLREVLDENPEFLVVGTGYYGLMKVSRDVEDFLAEHGIKLIVDSTREACKVFNELLRSGKKVVAALHLTC